MKLFSTICFVMIFLNAYAETTQLEKILQDDSFIVPGLGANRVIVNEEIYDVVQRFKQNSFKISKPQVTAELFKDILGVSSKIAIYLDAIYYNDENKFSLCVYQKRVVAIIGFNSNKITIDFVALNNGINAFIYHYGNKHLVQINNGSHGIFCYPDKGIALVDDDLNDTIDMYIIFSTRGRRIKP